MKIQELLKFGYDTLKKVNIETYMLDAQLLLGEALNVDKLFIITNRDMTVEDKIADEYIRLIKLREKKMPVKYIIKQAEFMGIDFFIKEGVLIPRGDTEILVEETLKEIKINNYKNICDVCCGSGAIGVAIAYYEEATNVICYDISDIALEVTEENVNKHKLNHRIKVNKSDLLSDAIKNKEKFDVVVSNPPYIKKDIIDTLMEDVKNYEPFIALCGGEDGLYFYRKLVIQSKEVLNTGGTLLFEIGYDQKEEVMKLMKDSGFKDVICIKDLSSNDRVVKGKLI
ncbi:release factor glutamine methyltransferase [Clostridium acidisoli DSM 12555]|uniref:Release factor glutamine methyltransferase n=1 Tax=Clostridium acidisoli DSM 12555 TaxID=1121291 RepID=A0A1W1XWB3_9CLOT|nr:peptide chain release factor N(5)-glutamine methyltransferase [Clostridium acidisoli]SMC28167.1 release factor glutamine methyltransferase [Clostridium acidisoli DSM 12555]